MTTAAPDSVATVGPVRMATWNSVKQGPRTTSRQQLLCSLCAVGCEIWTFIPGPGTDSSNLVCQHALTGRVQD